MSSLSSIYYDQLVGHAGASFANVVQTNELIEDELKTENIKITIPSLSNLPPGQ